MQKSRWLVQTLILSIALNAALLSLFFYFLIRENPVYLSYKPKTDRVEPSGCISLPVKTSFLERVQTVEYSRLIDLLNDERDIEQGYHVRDFALGALASYHDFDVERALERGPLSTRKWEFQGRYFLLFSGLSQTDFEKLALFAHHEQWPYTVKGLFKKIASASIEASDPSLIHFFCHTPEFTLLETLFARTHLPIQKRSVLALAIEGGWKQFAQYNKEMEKNLNFSSRVRQTYLLNSIANNSITAAYLLLLTDAEFAARQLDDRQIAKLLELLPKGTRESLQFVQQIASSPRSDAVRNKAIHRINEYRGNVEM